MLVSCVGTGWYAAWLVISLSGLTELSGLAGLVTASSYTALRRQSCFLNQYSLGLFEIIVRGGWTSPNLTAGRLYGKTDHNRGIGECFETLSCDAM